MNAGRARYDVLRIMRGVSGQDGGITSPLKSPRTAPQYDDILTSEDILKEKYQELGHLLAKQFVERKALSVLESSLLGQKKKRKPRARKKSVQRNMRPSSAKSFASEDSTKWYDSDYTDYTETSGVTSSGKHVSFADDLVSFSEESSVVITEITEDDGDFEERIKRKPRLSKEEEEAEAIELSEYKRHRIEQELIQSILRSPRPQSARNYTSPYGSKRVQKDNKESSNHDRKEDFRDKILSFSSAEESDDDNSQSNQQSRKKSPRKGKRKATLNSSNNSPRKGRLSSPTRRKVKSKGPRKTGKKEKEEEDEIPPELQQSPRKELDPIDNQLTNSKNKHIKAWLRQKDALIRRQKKEERKKEQTKREEQERVREERAHRLEESRERYSEWMNRKKRLNRSASKKAFDKVDQSQSNRSEQARPKSTGKASLKPRMPISIRRPPPKETPKTTHDNTIGIVRDYDGDWTDSINCKRDLAAERERDEEKRQAKEAKKREKIRKAKLAAEKKNEPKSQKPKRTFPRANSPKRNTESNEKAPSIQPQHKTKTKSSSNPSKGMTYDQWLNQKIKTEQTKKQEIDNDPDLEDLIPLLAKHRIEQATERSRRVDSGLNRSKSSGVHKSSNNAKNHQSPDGNGDNARPYTWKSNSETKSAKEKQWKSFPIGRNSYVHIKTPTPQQTPSKNSKIGTRKGDNDPNHYNKYALSSVRPEPQGCEISPTSHCESISKGSQQDGVFMTEAMCVK